MSPVVESALDERNQTSLLQKNRLKKRVFKYFSMFIKSENNMRNSNFLAVYLLRDYTETPFREAGTLEKRPREQVFATKGERIYRLRDCEVNKK